MPTTTQGAQVVERVALLLRLIAQDPVHGATTRSIVEQSGLTRPTVHRLLTSLAAEGLVDRAPEGRSWFLGPEIFVMGSVAQRQYAIEDIARPSLERLADETGESAFLSVRRGAEIVCLLGEEGSFPVRSFVLHPGVRFPLGVGTAGIAIMSFLDGAEFEAALAETEPRREAMGVQHGNDRVREAVARTRVEGFATNPGLILEGSWGIGAAVFDATEKPVWALSLTGIEQRFRADRRPALGRLILEEAHKLSQLMQGRPRARTIPIEI